MAMHSGNWQGNCEQLLRMAEEKQRSNLYTWRIVFAIHTKTIRDTAIK